MSSIACCEPMTRLHHIVIAVVAIVVAAALAMNYYLW
jgi:hypothetical protein